MAIFTRKSKNDNWEYSYKGMVVGKFVRDERIMSDVYSYCHYATVYDIVTDTVKEICVACDFDGCVGEYHIEVDASKELMEKYHEHLVREERHRKAVEISHNHNKRLNECHHMNVTLGEYKKIKKLGNDYFEVLYTLLGTKKFRNEFRAKMADQVRTWLKEENPTYRWPLSRRQFECVDTRHYNRW